MSIDVPEKIDGRFMTQIIMKAAEWKEEAVKSGGKAPNAGKIAQE